MAPSKNTEKIVMAVVAIVLCVVAWSLTLAGSFVPRWAKQLNTTQSDVNTTFSLWGREDCYGVICSTTKRMYYKKISQYYINEMGQKIWENYTREESVPIRKCVEANFCNITWLGSLESDDRPTPSLLLVSRAFTLPSLVTGLLTVILYIVKLILLFVCPLWKRIYLKAAYLTFAAIAGVTALIAVGVFAGMLEKDVYQLMWAPALSGAGGGLFFLIGVGGYLSWRNKSSFEDWDDRSEYSDRTSNMYEFSSSGKNKMNMIDVGRTGGYKSASSHSYKTDLV